MLCDSVIDVFEHTFDYWFLYVFIGKFQGISKRSSSNLETGPVSDMYLEETDPTSWPPPLRLRETQSWAAWIARGLVEAAKKKKIQKWWLEHVGHTKHVPKHHFNSKEHDVPYTFRKMCPRKKVIAPKSWAPKKAPKHGHQGLRQVCPTTPVRATRVWWNFLAQGVPPQKHGEKNA